MVKECNISNKLNSNWISHSLLNYTDCVIIEYWIGLSAVRPSRGKQVGHMLFRELQ